MLSPSWHPVCDYCQDPSTFETLGKDRFVSTGEKDRFRRMMAALEFTAPFLCL
jgi:hypothetical protein